MWNPKKKRPEVKVIRSLGRADTAKDEALEALAESIMKAVEKRRKELDERRGDRTGGVGIEWSKSLGGIYFLRQLWGRLGLGEIVGEVCGSQKPKAEVGVFLMAAERLAGTVEDAYFPEAAEVSEEQITDAEAMLEEHGGDLERAVFSRTVERFEPDLDRVYVAAAQMPLGSSTAAVVVTGEGLPVRSWVFPEGGSGPAVAARVGKDLMGWGVARPAVLDPKGQKSAQAARAAESWLVGMAAGTSPEKAGIRATAGVLTLLVRRAAEVGTGVEWPEIRRDLEEIRAVQYTSRGMTIVQTTTVPQAAKLYFVSLGMAGPERVLAVTEE